MPRYLPVAFAAALLLALSPPAALPQRPRRPRPTVTFVSPTECRADHGKWRWKVKTERDRPPAAIPADHRMTPAEIAAWDPPEDKITTRTPRAGREMEWYQVTGKVVLVKAEEDGDLHIQLGDPAGRGRLQVVVEVPVDHGHPNSAWSQMRKTVFSWSDQTFPFTTKTGHKLHLQRRPVIRVVGKAFYDAMHGKPSTPNRRRNSPLVTVWEIHPVMRLEVVRGRTAADWVGSGSATPGLARHVRRFAGSHTCTLEREWLTREVLRQANIDERAQAAVRKREGVLRELLPDLEGRVGVELRAPRRTLAGAGQVPVGGDRSAKEGETRT